MLTLCAGTETNGRNATHFTETNGRNATHLRLSHLLRVSPKQKLAAWQVECLALLELHLSLSPPSSLLPACLCLDYFYMWYTFSYGLSVSGCVV